MQLSWPISSQLDVFSTIATIVVIGVLSKHQRINLYYCTLDLDGVLKDIRFILVWAECPYVQFVAVARVISTEKFVVGVTNGQKRDRSQVFDGKVEWMLRAWLLLSYVRCDALNRSP